MTILYVAHYSRFYGANRSLLQLILHLREDYAVEPMVILPHEGPFTRELIKHNIPFKICKFHSWLNPKGTFFKSFIKSIVNIYHFSKIRNFIAHKHSFDIIHTNTSATELGSYLSSKLNVPHVWHMREYGEKDYGLKFTYGLNYAATKFNKASAVIAISKDIKEFYSPYICSNNIQVIYNGVEPPKEYPKNFYNGKLLKMTFVGSVSEAKNQLEAIKACQYLVNEKQFLNFELSIIGEGTSSYIDNIRKYVFDQNLEDYVKFIGYLPDVHEYLQVSDIGIVSSKSEAFGRVTVEYMMHKMPVIASNAGANPELISHGHTGYLYELGNYKELADYILLLGMNNEKVRFMGKEAYLHSTKFYSSHANATSIFKLYSKLLQ